MGVVSRAGRHTARADGTRQAPPERARIRKGRTRRRRRRRHRIRVEQKRWVVWPCARHGSCKPLACQSGKENPMTLAIYLIGWLIFIGGVSWALVTMHV